MTDDVRVPGIMHMTLLRFKRQPTDPLKWQQEYRRIVSRWEPLDVTVDRVYVAVEDRPYMHMPKDAEHLRPVLELH